MRQPPGPATPALPESGELAPDIIQQWSLRRPVWVSVSVLVSATVLVVVVALLADFLPENVFARIFALFAALSVLGWTLRLSQHHAGAGLCRLSGGQWRVLDVHGRERLGQAQVVHRWAGPGWLTLRLRSGEAGKSGQCSMDAVVWQRSVTPQAWRDLQKWTLREVAKSQAANAATGQRTA